jgi:hypothetical protein
MRATATACFLLVFLIGVVGSASAIDFSGFIQNSTGNLLAGITVYHTEDITKFSTPSAGDGSFTVAGLPSGTDFSLKMVDTNSSPAYATGYTRNFNRTTNASGSTFTLFTATQITTDWYPNTIPPVTQDTNGGTIRGRVVDGVTGDNIGGAKVAYTSSQGNPYPVYYYNGTTAKYVTGQATFANGLYTILNVLEGDTVTVTASKTGWIFSPITFNTHSGTLNVSVGNILGKTAVLYLPLILGN